MSEPSFLDWYPRGRLAFLSKKQSKDLKARIEFTESIASVLTIFVKIKSDLQMILDDWSFSNQTSDFSGPRLPSALQISPVPDYFFSPHVAEASRPFLLFTDYVCRFSAELMTELVRHPIFQKALKDSPDLASLSGSPVLIFDRAIYAIDLGEGADPLIIEGAFPPAQFDAGLEDQGHSGQTLFINSIGVTSAVLERDGRQEVFPVAAIHPFFSELSEDNKNAVQKFTQESALCLLRLLESETLIIKRLTAYFSSSFDSSVHLLKNREALGSVSAGGINA
jgi:hypothetical protein